VFAAIAALLVTVEAKVPETVPLSVAVFVHEAAVPISTPTAERRLDEALVAEIATEYVPARELEFVTVTTPTATVVEPLYCTARVDPVRACETPTVAVAADVEKLADAVQMA
jgi:hypothetical protein